MQIITKSQLIFKLMGDVLEVYPSITMCEFNRWIKEWDL